jgi:hypothetical protein
MQKCPLGDTVPSFKFTTCIILMCAIAQPKESQCIAVEERRGYETKGTIGEN